MSQEIPAPSDDKTPVIEVVTRVCGRDGCTNTLTGHPADIPADCGLHGEPADGGVNVEVTEDDKPDPRPHIYKCERGHEQRGSGEAYSLNRETGEVVARSGPICSRCQLEWLGKRFRTFDTGVEAPLPEGVEQ